MRKLIAEIIHGREFAFYSQYSLKECQKILQENSERDKRSWWKRSNRYLLIKTSSDNTNIVNFKMERRGTLGYVAYVIGSLQHEDDGTYIYGKAVISNLYFVISVVFIFIGILSFFTIHPLGVYFVVINTLMLMATANTMNLMYEMLEDLLGKSKKKHSERA